MSIWLALLGIALAYALGWLVGNGLLPGLTLACHRIRPETRAKLGHWWLVIFWTAEAGWLNGRGQGIGYTPFDAAWRALCQLWHAMRTYEEAWER